MNKSSGKSTVKSTGKSTGKSKMKSEWILGLVLVIIIIIALIIFAPKYQAAIEKFTNLDLEYQQSGGGYTTSDAILTKWNGDNFQKLNLKFSAIDPNTPISKIKLDFKDVYTNNLYTYVAENNNNTQTANVLPFDFKLNLPENTTFMLYVYINNDSAYKFMTYIKTDKNYFRFTDINENEPSASDVDNVLSIGIIDPDKGDTEPQTQTNRRLDLGQLKMQPYNMVKIPVQIPNLSNYKNKLKASTSVDATVKAKHDAKLAALDNFVFKEIEASIMVIGLPPSTTPTTTQAGTTSTTPTTTKAGTTTTTPTTTQAGTTSTTPTTTKAGTTTTTPTTTQAGTTTTTLNSTIAAEYEEQGLSADELAKFERTYPNRPKVATPGIDSCIQTSSNANTNSNTNSNTNTNTKCAIQVKNLVNGAKYKLQIRAVYQMLGSIEPNIRYTKPQTIIFSVDNSTNEAADLNKQIKLADTAQQYVINQEQKAFIRRDQTRQDYNMSALEADINTLSKRIQFAL